MPIKEDRYQDKEDKILQGFLLLAKTFLNIDPHLVECIDMVKFEG